MSDTAITLSDFHGQPALQLVSGDGARATVLLHGAHLVSWAAADGQEQLYLSPRAVFDGRQAVRGGVPVIFPQFNDLGSLPRHGFARHLAWEPVTLEHSASDALAVLRLVDSAHTRGLWPHAFIAELSLRITGQRLDMELAIENPQADAEASPVPLAFTAALHTYLRVADVGRVRLEGLHRLRYDDRVRKTQQIEGAPQLQIEAELDRSYYDLARPLVLHDGPRRVEITQQGFGDVVVWNPGAERCAALADMPPEGWREMLCVEAAALGQPVQVAAGACWIGRQSLTALVTEAASPDDETQGGDFDEDADPEDFDDSDHSDHSDRAPHDRA